MAAAVLLGTARPDGPDDPPRTPGASRVVDRRCATPRRRCYLLLTLLIVGFATVHYTHRATYLDEQFAGLDTKIDGLYFTMTVVSTVGFGDITPTGQAARAIVTVQMLFDLLFIGVAVRFLGQVVRAAARGHPAPIP